MIITWYLMCRTLEQEQENQKKTKIAKTINFVYLVMFIKLIFRQSNMVCIGISPLFIMKTNNFSGSGSYIIILF